MPALNEERNILAAMEATIRAFDVLGIEGQIVVVDDGSSDKTGALVDQYAQQETRIRKIRHETPKGIGASFWDGVQLSTHDVVTMFPGDNENDPREALRYLDLLEHVDIVVPFVYDKQARGAFRRLLSFLYREIINFSFAMNLNYTNGTVLYRRSILGQVSLKAAGFFYQTELLVKTIRAGYLFAEVPCALGKRTSGSSKAVTLGSFLNVAKSYLSLLNGAYLAGPRKATIDKSSVTYTRLKGQ